jgi:hypothetical protein
MSPGETLPFSVEVVVRSVPATRVVLTTFHATSPLAVELRAGNNRDIELVRVLR